MIYFSSIIIWLLLALLSPSNKDSPQPDFVGGQMLGAREALQAEPFGSCGLRPAFRVHRQRRELSLKIANGTRANFGQYPSYAYISGSTAQKKGPNRNSYCGGVLVGRRHVLTATHCLHNFNSMSDFVVILGLNGPKSKRTSVSVSRVCHEQNHCNLLKDQSLFPIRDLVILQLERQINYTDYIQPACLSFGLDRSNKSNETDNFEAVGMGWFNNWGDSPTGLLSTSMRRNCDTQMRDQFRQLDPLIDCYKSTDEANICHGDSGGPIYYYRLANSGSAGRQSRQFLAGLTSFGRNDCRAIAYPVAFTSVEAYEKQIAEMMAKNSQSCHNMILENPTKVKTC